MVWDVIDASKAHVAYAVVAVFSTVFSLCSLFVKEKLYLGEASVATIYGLIVGPHCLNWFNPLSWGNYFSITLEISRVLLCIEIVAVSVELPKKYVLKHWFSLFLLLIPCMTAGWLIIGAFIYAIIPGLTFTYGLLISACVTATDPILAQAVVGKGKFAKRVPAHLRNLLSAESACNDGISVPFVFLALNLILHSGDSKEIAKDWICVTVLYECGFGCIMGSLIGYLGRRSLKFAEKHELIDHESFLAFYIMLALLCAGFGSVLGVDDLLASFCAGSAFAWDGWFTDRTEESNVSTVIDILLNMAYFVYFGSIIPWEEFNDPSIGLDCWRLVILAIVVLILRRLPAVLLTKSLNPDIKNWKEAIFVGHFGPIGVGAVFAAIIAISDLEADVLHITHGPSTNYPQSSEFYQLIRIVWPVVCFLIVTSIIVHGSSVAVLTLGKQLQTMTFTMTWTKAETDGGKEGYWFNRLPKIERSGTSFSLRRVDTLANQAYDSDYKVSPSGTGAITDDEFGDEKVNAMLNANIGMERFGDVNDIPEHVSASKKGKPIGGANRKKQRRLLKRKKTKSTKRPPISETLDLSASHRNTSSIDYGNPVDEVDLGDEDEIRSDQINQQESLPETGNEEVPTAGESRRRESRISIPLQRILSNGSRSRSRSSTSAGFQGTIHANRDAIEKIKKDFDLSDEVLQPIEDEDGDLRVPTNVYNYNNNLVIEDQHGEVMHTVRSRANSVDTNNSLGSKRSRGNTLAKNITSAIGFSHGDGESSSSDSKDSSKIPKPTTIEEQLEDLEGAAKTEGTHKVESMQNLLKRTTLGTIKGISEGLFFKNELPRKTRKIHGYRVNDDIIIENEDGEILGRYKVNVKKQKAVQTAEGINSKEYDKSVVNKAMKYFGLMKQQEVVDEELNEINNEDFIPEQGNDFTSDGLEDRIKHFINADPKKVVVSLPQDLHHVRMGSGNLRKKLTKQKKRGMKKDKASASLQLPPPPQINIEDEDSEIDDIDDDADGDDSLETI